MKPVTVIQPLFPHDNVVTMPGVKSKPSRQGTPTEVFALKHDEDMLKIQQYFLDNNDLREWLYVVLGINIGLRGSDMVKLAWRDLLNPDGSFKTPQQSVVREQKTGKFRYIVLNNDAKEAITYYLKHRNIHPVYDNPNNLDYWVFKKNKLNPHKNAELHIARVYIGRQLTRAAEAVGITYRVSSHSLRKTFGHRLYEQGTPIEYIQKIFNHSSPSITLRYIGILDDDIAEYIGNLDSVLAILDDDDDE